MINHVFRTKIGLITLFREDLLGLSYKNYFDNPVMLCLLYASDT